MVSSWRKRAGRRRSRLRCSRFLHTRTLCWPQSSPAIRLRQEVICLLRLLTLLPTLTMRLAGTSILVRYRQLAAVSHTQTFSLTSASTSSFRYSGSSRVRHDHGVGICCVEVNAPERLDPFNLLRRL